jgi:small subunit ribosomal protein S2
LGLGGRVHEVDAKVTFAKASATEGEKCMAEAKKKTAVETVKKEKVEENPKVAGVVVDLKDLLEAGAHFGHQARRWNPRMKPYIFTTRDGVHIFDLTLTAQKISEAAAFITDWVAKGKEIVFVGTKRQAQPIVREETATVGAPFVAERWLGGMLTNWGEMEKRIKRLNDLKDKREKGELNHYTKRERGMIDKEIANLERFFGGIAKLPNKPEALFIVDTHKEVAAVKEANRLNLPIIGMVDTNANPTQVTIPIPINDDAVRSIKLVVTIMAEAYKKGKELKGKASVLVQPAEVSVEKKASNPIKKVPVKLKKPAAVPKKTEAVKSTINRKKTTKKE